MNRNIKLDQCGICSGDLSYLLFFAKREISFEVSTFGGSLFIYLFIYLFGGGEGGESLLPGFANTCDILSLLSEVRYFRWSMGRYFRNFTVALLVPNDAQSGFSSLPNDVG